MTHYNVHAQSMLVRPGREDPKEDQAFSTSCERRRQRNISDGLKLERRGRAILEF